MKKLLLLCPFLWLGGCVDFGKIGTHPEVASYYFNRPKSQVADCLIYSSYRERLSLKFDDTLPDGSERYNLQDKDSIDVAWIEVSQFSGKQTSVEFYYAPHDTQLRKSIISIVDQCK